ncbi:MAG: DNA polymerase III subunit alpha [Bradyrhizobium sp.]|nr:MAG: DNA polymerase III subunit alpha [Bradyrhizobium sp.]
MIRLAPRYGELATTTNFSFLRGASHPEELVERAAQLGLAGIGIADRNTLAGVVRAHVYARENREKLGAFRVVTGARLVFVDDAPQVIVYPKDRAAYGRLSRLLSAGNLRAPKGACHLHFAELLENAEGLQAIAMPGDRRSEGSSSGASRRLLLQLREAFSDRLWIGARRTYDVDMRGGLAERSALARRLGAPLIAVNDVLMHIAERRPLADVVACIREKTTLQSAGLLTQANAERHLKPPEEMARLFAEAPDAVEETIRFLDGITFSLDELTYEYPEELRQSHATPQAALEAFAEAGAKARYPDGVPESVRQALDHELALIGRLKYAPYFLTVHDIVRFAKSKDILCQGRGSAANSTVCFCLGITEVDPARFKLLFERFVSPERGEPPDIDVDFEHERRETVIQYIYERYGRERAGLAAAVATYRTRSAIRETAKVFGLSDDVIVALNNTVWGQSSAPLGEERARTAGLDPNEPTLALMLQLAGQLVGFPRHLSQHSGGFVIARDRFDEVAPIMNAAMKDRTMVEWDKDDLDALGILKVDVLALGMLTAMSKSLKLLERYYGRRLTLLSIPSEEACVYAMIQRADTIGVFQIESRAQMSMLPRLKPKDFYDLVIEVAIVRPGPIQGDMVHPYLRRRQGIEPTVYPSKELEDVLERTLGVPLFQEQAMQMAIVAAGFTPDEADKLRRAMATFRRAGTIQTFQTKMVEGMVARGYERDYAERCFHQIEGFGEYGFPESHAASFALIVYASCWMKCRYPDVFVAAMLNAQPLGFYAPAQLVRDAREHGVEMREVDVNLSDWDCTLEKLSLSRVASEGLHPRHVSMAEDICATHAVRLGLRQVNGAKEDEMGQLVAHRGAGYDSVRDLWLRSGLEAATLERLADADAFRSLGLDRREALWAVRGLGRVGDQDDLPLFALSRPAREAEPDAKLPPMPLGAHVVEDYRRLSLSLKAHPVAFMRARLDARGVQRSSALASLKSGARIAVGGLVLVRQRPGTANGVIFMTLEDETGIANLIVWPKTFERLRATVIGARFVVATGKLQNESGVVHLIVERMDDLTPMLGLLSREGSQDEPSAFAEASEQTASHRQGDRFAQVQLFYDPRLPPTPAQREAARALPAGRNFH